MRSLIVALLCLTLSVDTAKACWWRRHRTTIRGSSPVVRYQPLAVPVCRVPAEDTAEVMIDELVIDHDVSSLPFTDLGGTEVIASVTIDSLLINEQVEVSAEPIMIADDTSTIQALTHPGASPDTVVVHGPTLVIDTPPAVAPTQAPIQAPTPASVLPIPAGDTPLPTTALLLPDQPATIPTAVEPNLFDRYGDDATATDDDALLPAGDPAGDPRDQPSGETTLEETPAADEAPSEQSAEETAPEAAFSVPNEPIRRWINAAGTHQAQGWLVALRADRVRILKVNGRHTTVSRESLSAEDRAYVSAVSDRLTADRHSIADPNATVGL